MALRRSRVRVPLGPQEVIGKLKFLPPIHLLLITSYQHQQEYGVLGYLPASREDGYLPQV